MRYRSCVARLLALLAITVAPLAAQPSQVRVTLFRPPPNQLKVADLWRVRLDNTTGRTLTVYLFGRVDEARDGQIVDATTSRFTLPPGARTITGTEIQPIDANYFNTRYKDVFLRTGQAPSGDYTVCVTVRDAANDADLGTDCYDQRVEVVTPPILIAPHDEAIVQEKLPTFSWLPPSPLVRGTRPRYRLRIVEILGRQTPFDAMTSNPAFFERSTITPTLFQYPLGTRSFRDGARYAWRIIASEGTFPLGESEIWWFTWKPLKIIRDNGDNEDPFGGRDDGGVISDNDTSLIRPGRRFTIIQKGLQFGDIDEDRERLVGLVAGRPELGLSDRAPELLIPLAILEQLLSTCSGD